MSFRIESRVVDERIVLHLHGQLVGAEAERLLREQIVRAVAGQGHVVIDASEMTVFDPACLAVIQAGLGDWLTLEGGGAYLELMLRRQ
ncbi:MAG TPA: STAS domain-containing protein [Polyangia bacterium]|nr:STAS domain-containing protein [Polyangia bacterium]